MSETKEQAATAEKETADAGQEKKLTELDLIKHLIARAITRELNKLLAENEIVEMLIDKIKIADFKASICYELLTEKQREQARKLMQERITAEGRKWEPIEEVLERAKDKL